MGIWKIEIEEKWKREQLPNGKDKTNKRPTTMPPLDGFISISLFCYTRRSLSCWRCFNFDTSALATHRTGGSKFDDFHIHCVDLPVHRMVWYNIFCSSVSDFD